MWNREGWIGNYKGKSRQHFGCNFRRSQVERGAIHRKTKMKSIKRAKSQRMISCITIYSREHFAVFQLPQHSEEFSRDNVLYNAQRNCKIPKSYIWDDVPQLACSLLKFMTVQLGKTLNKYGLFGRFAKRKPFLFKENMAVQLRFAAFYLNKQQDFWKNVLWTDETWSPK